MTQLVLTESGYVAITPYIVGVKVKAFDQDTGEVIWNTVESVRWVDAAEWMRWHENADLPPFRFFRINDTWTLNSEQSIWRNGTNVCHAKHLIVGDEIYDDANNPVTITSVEEVTADGWWRFDISGDHSYIVDGLMLHNASRFAVNVGGIDWTWDLSTTTHWSASTGGGAGSSAPGSADTVTFDGSSGGHVVTPSYAGTGTFQSITCGAFTGTIDWSVNNNPVTLSAATPFSGTGSGTRTINLGNGTWTLNATGLTGNVWDMTTTTGLTFNANSSTISFTGVRTPATNAPVFVGGGLTYSTLNFVAQTASSMSGVLVNNTGTFATLTVAGPNVVLISSISMTITTLNINGTKGNAVHFAASTFTNARALTLTTLVASWAAFRGMNMTGSNLVANNSFDLGFNTNLTINPPSIFDKSLFSQPGLTY
jgi:hypothetical protein